MMDGLDWLPFKHKIGGIEAHLNRTTTISCPSEEVKVSVVEKWMVEEELTPVGIGRHKATYTISNILFWTMAPYLFLNVFGRFVFYILGASPPFIIIASSIFNFLPP